MKACLNNLEMFCFREKLIGLIAKQQNEKSTLAYLYVLVRGIQSVELYANHLSISNIPYCYHLTNSRVLHAKPSMSETNSVTVEWVTTLTVCILIDGRDVLPDIFRNEDFTKGVLIGTTHMEPRSVHALKETTFLVTYLLTILAEDIGFAIEKINEWLGKPVVITCDKVPTTQLPQVLECACHTSGIESVVFNTGLDEIRTESIPIVCSGYQS